MKQKNTKSPIQKRSFLLLEVLIALTLVVFCLFPLLKPLATIKHKERERYRHLQDDYVAHLALFAAKEELFENKIPWEALNDYEKGPLYMSCHEEFHKRTDHTLFRLVEITYVTPTHTYTHPLLVKRVPQ